MFPEKIIRGVKSMFRRNLTLFMVCLFSLSICFFGSCSSLSENARLLVETECSFKNKNIKINTTDKMSLELNLNEKEQRSLKISEKSLIRVLNVNVSKKPVPYKSSFKGSIGSGITKINNSVIPSSLIIPIAFITTSRVFLTKA